jgi:predicted PurR-regulated permease PerM
MASPSSHDRQPPPPPGRPAPATSLPLLQPEHLYKATALLFLFLVFYRYFAEISRILLIVYAAAILAVALNVVVGLVPTHRRLMSATVGLLILSLVAVGLWIGIPALGDELRGLVQEGPRFEEAIQRWEEWLQQRIGIQVELFGEQTLDFLRGLLANAAVLGTARSLLEAIFIPLLILFGALYAVGKPNSRLLTPFLQALPREKRDDFRRLLTLLGSRLKGWVKGTLLGMLVVGTLTTAGLYLIGVEYALLLGVTAGLLEIVPILGPWIAGAVAVGIAFIDDPTKALWVALLMLAIQQLESNLITPFVMSSAAKVHPFVTLFALFLFGSIFGFLGVILALPIVILLWTVLEVLWVERAIDTDEDRIEPLVKE